MHELLNFDLAIEAYGDGYRARVVGSPAGEAEANFDLPFSDKDLEILVLKVVGSVGRTRRKVRRLESVERRMLENFGGNLFQAVFSGSVRNCLDRSLATAESNGAGLRIRLRLPAALANVPWEYLYDRESGFVCLSPETPLVRYVSMPKPVRPFPVSPPLRILAMISAPSDVPKLQNEAEWDKLRSSLSDLSSRGLVQTERLPFGTLAALQRPLRQRDYHVLHFVGHGLYDEAAQDGALALEGNDGQARLVTGRDLGMMLRGHRSLRLVVLNACEGARGAVDDPFGGVAQALVRQGVPAVIAMQFEISDPAALVFTQSFYQALGDGLPVDVAMVESRRAMFAAGNEVEWATPVLYLRAADGRVFDLPTTTAGDDPIGLHDDADYLEGQAEYSAANWDRAVELWARALTRYPDHPLLKQQLAGARQQRQWAEWDAIAKSAMEQSRWKDAILALERLSAARGNDPELTQRLQAARAGQASADLQASIRRLHASGQWFAVIETAGRLAELDPMAGDPDGLIADARAEIAELELADRYNTGVLHLDRANWVEAEQIFTAILEQRPNYRDCADLLRRARTGAASTNAPEVAEMHDRLVARLIDGVIFLIPILTLTPEYEASDGGGLSTGETLRLLAIFLTIAVYEVVLTAVWGSTLGKRIVRLKVVRSSDEAAVGWREALLRWVIQFLAWWPCLIVGALVLYASPLWDKTGRRRGWHDKVAGTVVVKLPPD